jgi:antitoxin HicB
VRKKSRKAPGRCGSNFDSFLEEEGIRQEVEAVAIQRVLAWQLEKAMQQQKKNQTGDGEAASYSRSQPDRLLDPGDASVTLDTIARAARALAKRVVIRVADVKTKRASLQRVCVTDR